MVKFETQTLIVKFKIEGNLRFLSHRETSTMLQRALVRLELPLRYSEGFNPRPRMSLPLPRSVGVASDDEALCVLIEPDEVYDPDTIYRGLGNQLPDGCAVTDVSIRQSKISMQPKSAVYEFRLKPSTITESFQEKLKILEDTANEKKPLLMRRQSSKRKRSRLVDVSPYIADVNLEEKVLKINYFITPSGSIRVEEIMMQLDLTAKDFSAPIRRTSVEWLD